MTLTSLKAFRYLLRELKNLFEFFVFPILVVIFPHKIYYPIFRFICRYTFFYSVYSRGTYNNASNFTNQHIPKFQWEQNVRLLHLVDIADLWLFWLRPKKANKLFSVSGKWNSQNGFIALGTHWGTGFPALVTINQYNKKPFFVYSQTKVPFSDRGFIESKYRKLRHNYIDKISGSLAITVGKSYDSIKQKVSEGDVPVLLFDAPKDKNKAKQFLKVGEHNYPIASGFVNLICQEKLPFQLYSVSLDFKSGKRHLAINELIVSIEQNQLIKKLGEILSELITKSPEQWFFWRQSNLIFSKDKPSLKIPILLYHSANISGNQYNTNDCIAFENDLKTIKECGINIISTYTLIDYLTGKIELDRNKKYVVITFDDGVNLDFIDSHYLEFGNQKSFYTSMKEFQEDIHATSFVIASSHARKNMDVDCLNNQKLITDDWWRTASESNIFAIENHSWDHVHPSNNQVFQQDNIKGDFNKILTVSDADNQIQKSSEFIDDKTNKKTCLFAYPYGDYNDFMSEEYFPNKQNKIKAAFTCDAKYVTKNTNIWKIPRFICGKHWQNSSEFKKLINLEYIMNKKPEFFIVGSVLSGTTLLRNILREHPNLIAPEETHVFRWGYPFGAEEYKDLYKNADTFKLHRKIDGVDEDVFNEILTKSSDKKSFMENYFTEFAKLKGVEGSRFFDKSPQNVYGMVLIKAYFPKAKFIHIIRNPYNVVASIKRGHPGLAKSLTGAINYWKEAILITRTLKKAWNDDIFEFKYEDLAQKPEYYINNILNFLEEEQVDMSLGIKQIREVDSDYTKVLTSDEINQVTEELGELIEIYGYKIDE